MLTNTEWSHLPNAVHIDRVIASIKLYPIHWNSTWNRSRDEVWGGAWDNAWDNAWDTVWDAARGAAIDAIEDTAYGAILCLIAYDDCAYMLDSNVGELKILAAFGDQRAILLLHACTAFHIIKEIG